MPFLFALISINVLSVPLILVMCGKKENENNGNQPRKQPENGTSKTENNTVQIAFSADETAAPSNYKRPDVYHEVAEKLAFPASVKCKNHDDAWRILALYLDYIRAVNPVEFEKFRMLDSALAVLHDFSYQFRISQIPNETLALAVVYFLVDFHKINVNLGAPDRPWFTILCRNAKFEEMEHIKFQIENFLIGMNSEESSGNRTNEVERVSV